MRRFAALLLTLILSLSLAACGNETGATPAKRDANTPGNSLERGIDRAEDDLKRAKDNVENNLDRMLDDGDLTDDPNR